MLISQIIDCIEAIAPLSLQESYDNAGLLTGNASSEVTGALVTLDVTEGVIDEAVALGFNLILAHHPILFKPLKKITGGSDVERCLIKAIKNDIAIYSAHTNLDNSAAGVNAKLCEMLGLQNQQILSPMDGQLRKLVVFVPLSHAQQVKQAMFETGAGHIGNYDSCSFTVEGEGSFRPLSGSNPYSGSQGKLHTDSELRIETVVPAWREKAVIAAMLKAHPYEEVAWDSYTLNNKPAISGAGMTGQLKTNMMEAGFIELLKAILKVPAIKCSPFTGKEVQKVAVCGGSGNFLIRDAIHSGAQVFVTGELKYHDYFMADGKILLVEAGHFETEQFTKQLLVQIVKEKFPTFALQISAINTNPVNYL